MEDNTLDASKLTSTVRVVDRTGTNITQPRYGHGRGTISIVSVVSGSSPTAILFLRATSKTVRLSGSKGEGQDCQISTG